MGEYCLTHNTHTEHFSSYLVSLVFHLIIDSTYWQITTVIHRNYCKEELHLLHVCNLKVKFSFKNKKKQSRNVWISVVTQEQMCDHSLD